MDNIVNTINKPINLDDEIYYNNKILDSINLNSHRKIVYHNYDQ
jgi:hypothetical protein